MEKLLGIIIELLRDILNNTREIKYKVNSIETQLQVKLR